MGLSGAILGPPGARGALSGPERALEMVSERLREAPRGLRGVLGTKKSSPRGVLDPLFLS